MGLMQDRFEEYGFGRLDTTVGETVTYTPRGGTGSSKTVIFEPEKREPEFSFDGETEVQKATVYANPSEIAAISEGDEFTRGGINWYASVDGWTNEAGYIVAQVHTTETVRKINDGNVING